MRQMNYQQLEHRALKVRDHNGGQYRGKRLCQTCLMEKAGITSAEEQVAFDDELLVELIDLYCEERKRQSSEMQQALGSGESKIAHSMYDILTRGHGEL